MRKTGWHSHNAKSRQRWKDSMDARGIKGRSKDGGVTTGRNLINKWKENGLNEGTLIHMESD